MKDKITVEVKKIQDKIIVEVKKIQDKITVEVKKIQDKIIVEVKGENEVLWTDVLEKPKEENLSDKSFIACGAWYKSKDIKEAVKRLKRRIYKKLMKDDCVLDPEDCGICEDCMDNVKREIDAIFGDKLT